MRAGCVLLLGWLAGCATVPAGRSGPPPCLVEAEHATRHHAALYARHGLAYSHSLMTATDGAPEAHALARRAETMRALWPLALPGMLGGATGGFTMLISDMRGSRSGVAVGGALLGVSFADLLATFALLASTPRVERRAIERYNDWAAEHGCPDGIK